MLDVAVRAPGRVNLIGDHTDYNDCFVLPLAIDLECRVVGRGTDGPLELRWREENADELALAVREAVTTDFVNGGHDWFVWRVQPEIS